MNENYHSKCPINYDYDNCSSKEYGLTCDTCCHYNESTFKLSDLNVPREIKIEMKDAELNMKGFYGLFYGLDIIEDKNLTLKEFVRVKTHKRKRIDKKWAKRYGFKTVTIPDKNIYVLANNKIIAHPSMIHKVVEAIKNNENVRYL